MTKNVIKEIIIILLLMLAIILVLGVLLYEYVPSKKIIPEKISYTTPENVRLELGESENIDTDEVVVTYQIDATDLNNYKKIQEYVPGKKNPFASVEETTTQTNSSSGNTSSSTSGGSQSGSSSSSAYLPDKGLK